MPQSQPSPLSQQMSAVLQQAERDLIRIFVGLETALVDLLGEVVAGGTAVERAAARKQIRSLAGLAYRQIEVWAIQHLRQAYTTGKAEAVKELKQLAAYATLREMAYETGQLVGLVESALTHTEAALAGMQRTLEQTLAKIAVNPENAPAAAEAILKAITLHFPSGAAMALPQYGEVTARFNILKAVTLGKKEEYRAAGIRLVRVTGFGSTCPYCAPLEGKVFALEPGDPDYPYIGDLIPRHPNCLHRLEPVLRPRKDHPIAPEWALRGPDREIRRTFAQLYPETMRMNRRGFVSKRQAQVIEGVGRRNLINMRKLRKRAIEIRLANPDTEYTAAFRQALREQKIRADQIRIGLPGRRGGQRLNP